MLKAAVLAHYKTPKAAAEAIGVTDVAVFQWGPVVPLESAFLFEIASDGELRVDLRKYEGKRPGIKKLARKRGCIHA